MAMRKKKRSTKRLTIGVGILRARRNYLKEFRERRTHVVIHSVLIKKAKIKSRDVTMK